MSQAGQVGISTGAGITLDTEGYTCSGGEIPEDLSLV